VPPNRFLLEGISKSDFHNPTRRFPKLNPSLTYRVAVLKCLLALRRPRKPRLIVADASASYHWKV
jgi:hypothetical protein